MMNIKVALGSATVLACALVGCGSDDDGSSSADAETVIVANGNADNGSAGRMTDALRLAGFSTGEAVNSQDKVADSIVYYSDANGSQDVAVKVAVALGGVDVESLPDPAPTDSGSLDGGGVLLLLGQNQADKTLEELNGGGGSTGGDKLFLQPAVHLLHLVHLALALLELELELLDHIGDPARAEALPCDHLRGAGAEHGPHRHFESTTVRPWDDTQQIVGGHT